MLMKVRWILATFLLLTCWINLAVLSIIKPKKVTISNTTLAATTPVDNSLQADLNITSSQQQLSKAEARRSKLKILIPLYIYPNWYERDKYIWKQVASAGKKVPIVAIINPNNGPDSKSPNVDYQQGLKDLHQSGVKIVGYVHSGYGKRDLSLVKADIDLYLKYFNVDGIFVDETASSKDKLEYYNQIYKHIKSQPKSLQVIINPGTDLDESYIKKPVADVAVIFENEQKVWSKYHPPVYTKHYSSQHFAALIHTTANSQLMKTTLDRAANSNFGYVYITNDSTNSPNHNPWDTLPSYWQSQVDYIQKLNDRI